MMRTNPAGADIAPKELIGQIAFPSQELMAPAHGVLKMEIFQAMQRIVMDKGAHGPVLGDDLAGEQDQPSELHPPCFAVRCCFYLFHSINSMAVR